MLCLIEVLDIYSLENRRTFLRNADQRTPVALAQAGYLAASPLHVSLAISFKTLALFRTLRLRKPSLSFEAFAKVICDSYNVQSPYYFPRNTSNYFI